MKGKILFAALLVAISLTAPAGGQETKRTTTEKKEVKAGVPTANYIHVVVFKMKQDAPKDAVAAAIADCHEMLAKIPSVRAVKAGRPAEQATPNLAKKDYDFALLVLVDDFSGLKSYLEHPTHLKFVEKHGPHFNMEQTRVFDFTNEKK